MENKTKIFCSDNFKSSGVEIKPSRWLKFKNSCSLEFCDINDQCVFWHGPKEKKGGIGYFYIKGKKYTVRKLIYIWTTGVRIEDLGSYSIRCSCENSKTCISPNHIVAHRKQKRKKICRKKVTNELLNTQAVEN